MAGPTLATFFRLGGGTAPLQPEALAPTPAPRAHRLPLPICPPRKGRPWDRFPRRHLDCLFSGPPPPQRRGSDPSPFPRVPLLCLPRQVVLDRPTFPCPCSERACLHPWTWSPSLECCSLMWVTLRHWACSALAKALCVPVCEAACPLDPLSVTKLLGRAPAQAGSAAEPGTKGSLQAPGVLRESQGQLQGWHVPRGW